MDALDLDTPALYVDLDVLEHNIARMQEQCRAWGVALRPHVKTHKIPEIARLQVVSTAVPGQCVIDAGSKTFSSDQTVGAGTFGHFVGRAWTMRKLNEEHGYVETQPLTNGESRDGATAASERKSGWCRVTCARR